MRMPVRLVARPGGTPLGLALLVLGVAGAFGIMLLGLDRLPFAVCTFKAMTGLPCFTCGGTRAAARLARLDVAGALAMNPLVAVGAMAMVPWALADLVLRRRGSALGLEVDPAARVVLRWLVVALAVANWGFLLASGR